MKPLDLTKPIQTRDGRPAKFLHKLDTQNQYRVVCVVNFGVCGKEFTVHFTETGEINSGSVTPHDLINTQSTPQIIHGELEEHPWFRFLQARVDAIDWLYSEDIGCKGNPEAIAEWLSMDPVQVELIRTKVEEITTEAVK